MSHGLHISVLTTQVLTFLLASEGGRFLDCTLGGGGHSLALIKANEANTVVAIDRDTEALKRTDEIFMDCSRIKRMHAAFSDLGALSVDGKFDGILADLGLSMMQIKGARGFSFNDETELDMRMDRSRGVSAADLISQSTQQEIFLILKRGGVGRDARRIAQAIINAKPITTPKKLANVISSAVTERSAVHPATVAFQAIRMEVNQEIAQIESLLDVIPSLVKENGRAAVITFHSIEDKLVTKRMRTWAAGSTEPASWGGKRERSLGQLLTKKPVVPEAQEIEANPASRSARLRVFQFSGLMEN